jgi:integrase
VHELLPTILATPLRTLRMQQDMRAICAKLGVNEKVTPHDLRRTFSSRVTALGFGREAMNRANNPQQSWGFDGEPPEAVMKDSGTSD